MDPIKLKYIPNLVTTVRLILILPLLVTLLQGNYQLSFYIFMIAALSDGLDGFLARQFNWTSRFGAAADAAADKLLMLATYVALTWVGELPLWLLFLVVGRDIFIVVGVLLYRYRYEAPKFAPTLLSKANTFLQILLVLLILLHYGIAEIPYMLIQTVMYVVVASTLLSFVDYSRIWGKRILRMPKDVVYRS